METAPAAVYEPRNPRAGSLHALVEDYYEEFERVYDDRYQHQYGRWRPVVGEVMRKYLQCGDLHRGFALLGCHRCRYQAILAYSCKCRLFCPSCQQKRLLLFAEWLDIHILEPVSHAQFVFTIPKLLRPIFKYHPKDLGLLCQSAWQALKQMFEEVATDPSALPGVVLSVQSYGDRLNLHPHVHAIASRGVWSTDGSFEAIPALDTRPLMLLFRHHVLNELLACGRIRQATVDILDRFHHPGFSAYEGEGVPADDSAARERLASYLAHAPFSLAALTAFIPEKGQQIVRYYGYYSNKARGQRRRQSAAAAIAGVTSGSHASQDDDFRRFCRRAWARFIRKVCLADPLTYPKCGGRLRILSFIDNPSVIEKILRHLKLWNPPERPPPARPSTTVEADPEYLDWAAIARRFDGID